MSSSSSSNSTGNPVLDHAGFSATVFAIIVFCGFIGAIYNTATSHHDSGGSHGSSHGSEHKAAPAAH